MPPGDPHSRHAFANASVGRLFYMRAFVPSLLSFVCNACAVSSICHHVPANAVPYTLYGQSYNAGRVTENTIQPEPRQPFFMHAPTIGGIVRCW